MRITELFGAQDTTKTWEWKHFDNYTAEATFNVGDVPYRFIAYQDPYEAPGDWDVEFVIENPPPGASHYGITGTGRSSEVFSTVVNIMKEFINKKGKSIRRLTFAAKEGSRQDLYARMIKRLLPDWTFEQKGANFILTRPNLTWWVYSVEPPYDKIKPIKITAPSADKAEEMATGDPNSPFKGADSMGIAVKANRPRR